MFTDGTELPLFSGTSIPATERQFVPEDHSMKQGMLPGMPAIDYERVLERDRALRRQKHTRPAPLPTDTIVGFTASPDEMSGAQPAEPAMLPEEAPAPAPMKRIVYQGNVNSAMLRIAEAYREPIKLIGGNRRCSLWSI